MIYVNNFILLVLLVSNMAGIIGKNLPVDKVDNTTSRIEVLTNESSTPTIFEIPHLATKILCNSTGSPTSQFSLIFTQGATGDLSSPAVANFVDGFSESKKIISFFGKSNLKSRTKMFKTVIEHHPCNVLGGRSLGSRVAIKTAKETDNVKALVLVSFPLRGRKGQLRHHLLLEINETIDVLLVIGSDDELCELNELISMIKRMKNKVWLVVVKNANHLMEMSTPSATRPVGKMVGRVVARWIEQRNETLTNCEIHWDDEQNDVVVSPWNGMK